VLEACSAIMGSMTKAPSKAAKMMVILSILDMVLLQWKVICLQTADGTEDGADRNKARVNV
jgi:hypothetical protein